MSILVLLALLAQTPDFLEQGNRAIDAKQYDQAIDLFTKAAAADPKDYAAEFSLGLAYSLEGKDADAIPHYRSALTLKPGLYQAELNLALSLMRTGAPTDALPHFEAALAQKPSATAETGIARALLKLDRPSEAEPHFRQAATLDPSRKNDLLELAPVYESRRQTAEAIAIYREFPDNPGAQERIGKLLAESGQTAAAIPALEAAVAKSPTAVTRIALAQAYLQEKQVAKAEAVAAQASAAEPRDAELHMFYGRILRDQRKLLPASNEFLAAAKIQPASVEAWSELSAALMAAEQYSQGLAALDQIRALHAEKPGHLFYRGLANDHLNQKPQAIEAYQQFLAASQGKFPDQEFQARQRVRILEVELKKSR